VKTPSQTIGPFFGFGLCTTPLNELPGETVLVRGRVSDADGAAVVDALLEVWHPEVGFGRCGTDAAGAFQFLVPRCRHLEVMVFARGLLKPVLTRMYLAGEADAEDPSMVAQPEDGGLRFDIHLAGERETAFFEL
jgi:protocatechuate 3,4-dioxygenase, alpha subunit